MPDAIKLDYDPNARYDTGPNAAGCNGVSPQAVLSGTPGQIGLDTDGVLENAHRRVGFNAAGSRRNNTGPNCAGSPRSSGNT